jgi:putative sterol carrier protein
VGPSKEKALLTFKMREKDFIDLIKGRMDYMKAIGGKKLQLRGNVLNVMRFWNGFISPYLGEYLYG